MNTFLMELLSEEIPASDQIFGRQFLEDYFSEKLSSVELSYSDIITFSSPRRLTILIKGVQDKAKTIREEKRGPRESLPEKALSGFLSANNVKKKDLIIRDIKGIKYYFLVKEIKGKENSKILADISEQLIKDFRWKKSMRWGSSRLRWVRPLKSILALKYSDKKVTEVINFQINGIKSGSKTVGHRFMSPEPFMVRNFDEYIEALKANFVELDHKKREEKISNQLENLAKNEGLEVVKDEKLIEEVSGLVEWPVAMIGNIEKSFLDLPAEILQTVMKTHQKYFSVKDSKTDKIVKYITVANIVSKDNGEQILAGNNRVLNSRLSDASFFWKIDKARIAKNGFEGFAKDLEFVTFFKGLGTQASRVTRLKKIACRMNKNLYNLSDREINLAAGVCKADLVSSTVNEFPELQGLLGSYFSKMSGFSDNVSWACKDHYRPMGPHDQVPTKPLSVTIALADKIDLLASFWSINKKPTGSKDPFGLRRAAIGIIRLAIENEIDMQVKELFHFSEQDFDVESITDFLTERLRVYLKDNGSKVTTFQACLESASSWGISSLVARIVAIDAFLKTKDGQKLLQLSKRALNILLAEEKKDGVEYSLPPERFKSLASEETDIIDALEVSDKKVSNLMLNGNYSDALVVLSNLHPKVERFFEKIQINSDNSLLRRNRLCILGLIRSMLSRLADFSILE